MFTIGMTYIDISFNKSQTVSLPPPPLLSFARPTACVNIDFVYQRASRKRGDDMVTMVDYNLSQHVSLGFYVGYYKDIHILNVFKAFTAISCDPSGACTLLTCVLCFIHVLRMYLYIQAIFPGQFLFFCFLIFTFFMIRIP